MILTQKHITDFREEQIMIKNFEDFTREEIELTANLSALIGRDLRTAMDNARNAMEEFKDIPTPTLPPIRRPKIRRGNLAEHRGRNAAAPGRLNLRIQRRSAHNARRCK